MGNLPSHETDESNLCKLSSDTVSYLKRFSVFSEFPKDRNDADKIISNLATNALKYVNSNFNTRLGGHNKRKRIEQLGDLPINAITPSSRKSRRRVKSPLSNSVTSIVDRNNITLITPVPNNNHPSFIRSAISYRVLLPNDLFRLEEGDRVVLVVDSNSYGFQRNIRDCLQEDVLLLHSRAQLDSIKYEFEMNISAFNIKNEILSGSLSEREEVLRYNQGDGISLKSCCYPGLKYNVRFKDLLPGCIQLYEKTDHSFDHPDFFSAAGRSRDPRIYGPIYKAFLNMVHGDSEQTLRVLVAYYRQKTVSLIYAASLSPTKQIVPEVVKSINSNHSQHLIKLEMGKADEFCRYVDKIFERSVIDHLQNWHDPSAPLVNESNIDTLLVQFETLFPLVAYMYKSGSIAIRIIRKTINTTNTTSDLRKRYLCFRHFLSMNRLKSHKNLIWWAMVETLSQLASGLSKKATYTTAMARYSLSYGTVFRKLNKLTPLVKEYNKRLLQNECSLDTGFDNFQMFMSKKFQRDGTSATSMHATCRLAKRSFPVLPPVGSVVMGHGKQYTVIGIVHHMTYAALVRIQCLTTGTRHPLPWPTIGWVIVSLFGSDDIPSTIDYRLCYVPRSLHMKKTIEVNKTSLHMIFSSESRKVDYTSKVTPCNVNEYMSILKSSRTVAAIHKALALTKKKTAKTPVNMNMTDQLNMEILHYHDQSSIDNMVTIFNTNKNSLLSVRLFQEEYVKSWNSNISEVSQLMYLDLSKFDEISNDGCIQVLVELLHDFGLIDKDMNKPGHYVGVDNLSQRRLRIYGDCLSMDKIRSMENRIYSCVTHPGKAEFVNVILDALERCQQGVGDLHIGMHMLVLIYKIYYPGMLQVVQAVLRWKRVQLNPLHRYQSSKDLAIMTWRVLERMRIEHWCRMLKRDSKDTTRTRTVTIIEEMKGNIDGDDDLSKHYSLDELTEVYDHSDVVLILSRDYELFCNELLLSNDGVVRTIANYMRLVDDMVLYTDSIACGDSISMEVILNKWLPLWKAGGKPHYTNLTMTNMEILYNEMSPTDLEGMRINRCVRRTKDRNMMAMDECCEILNDYLKKMSNSENLNNLVSKSLFVSLMRRCKNIIGPYNSPKNKDHGLSIMPSRIRDMKAVTVLFTSVLPFTSMNRSVGDNWLWESYNSSKLPIRANTTIGLTTHQQKVADVFNHISTSLPTQAPEEHTDETTVSNIETIHTAAEDAHNKLLEDDVYIEDDNGEMEIGSKDNNPINTNKNIQDVDESNEDPEDALRSLSNLKKYKINDLCHKDIFAVGWLILGDNMEEDRRWKHTIQSQEREQIREAVAYYIKNESQRRNYQTLTLSNNNTTMKWEMRLRHARNNHKERIQYSTSYR